jgi:hypothetical protein
MALRGRAFQCGSDACGSGFSRDIGAGSPSHSRPSFSIVTEFG